MKRIHERTACELAEAFRKGELRAVEIAGAFLDRIARLDGKVKAFISTRPEQALDEAKSQDARREKGAKLGPLAGVPVAIKDNICTRGWETTCGSRMLENFKPPYDATVVKKLRAADAIIVGKTNLDEFAFGSSTENSGFFATHNPHDLERVPGGSSGGSCAAVAAGMVPVALGSETGGSVRQPAGFCGITGLKPTYGRVSRYGLVAFGSSLDQISPCATDAADVALMLGVIAGKDPRDSTSADAPVNDYAAELPGTPNGLKLGIPKEYLGGGLSSDVEARVREAIDRLAKTGFEIVEVSLPHTRYAVAAYYVICTAEASSNLSRYDGVHYGYRTKEKTDLIDLYSRSREESFGAEVKRRVMLGTYSLSSGYYDAYYLKALKVRRLIKRDFDRAWERADAIVCPVSPTTAFRIGERVDDPLSMYLADIFTVPASLAGLPGISVPCGVDSDGLPVGLQIMAPNLAEGRLLRIAAAWQRETDYHRMRADL